MAYLHQNWFMDKRFEMFEEFVDEQWFYDTQTKCIYTVQALYDGTIKIIEHSEEEENDMYSYLLRKYKEWKQNN